MAEIKRKRKFNVVDLVLVLIIAAIIVAVVFIGSNLMNKEAPTVTEKPPVDNETIVIEYVIRFGKLQNSATGNIREGDTVRNPHNGNKPWGHVTEIFHEPYSELVYSENEQNKGVMAVMDGYTNMLVTVRSEATRDERGYYVGGYKLLVGKSVEIWSAGYTGSGYCLSIREVG